MVAFFTRKTTLPSIPSPIPTPTPPPCPSPHSSTPRTSRTSCAGSAPSSRRDDLVAAASYGRRQSISFLISAGATLNAPATNGRTPLTAAAASGRVDSVLQLLASPRTVVDASDDVGTPLMWAVRAGHAGVVKMLLEAGAGPATVGEDGCCPLGAAVGDVGILAQLLKVVSKENIDTTDFLGRSPLLLAASAGALEAVQMLLAAGANPNHADIRDETPLIVAAEGGFVPVIRCLVEAGAGGGRGDTQGNSLSTHAVKSGSLDVLKEVLKASRTPRTSGTGLSAVAAAAAGGQEEMVKLLLDDEVEKQELDLPDTRGLTALHKTKSAKIASLLLDAGANVFSCDLNGKSPLTHAHDAGNQEVAHLLAKAVVSADFIENEEPIVISALLGDASCISACLSSSSSLDHLDSHGNNLLILACVGGNLSSISYLLSSCPHLLNLPGASLRTPLHAAAANGRAPAVAALVAAGADVAARASNGLTAMQLAAGLGHREVVDALVAAGARHGAVELSESIQRRFKPKTWDSRFLIESAGREY